MAKIPKPSKSQAKKIRAIQRKNYSASYEKRLIRGVLQGKKTQEARGHRKGEAAQRREYQRNLNEGLTTNEIFSIEKWYNNKFNPHDQHGKPNLEDVIQFARDQGIEKFRQYQKAWNEIRRQYLNEQKRGKYQSRGPDFFDDLFSQLDLPDDGVGWLYYH